MPSRTKVLCAASTPSLGPYLVIRGPSSWALLTAVIALGYETQEPEILEGAYFYSNLTMVGVRAIHYNCW